MKKVRVFCDKFRKRHDDSLNTGTNIPNDPRAINILNSKNNNIFVNYFTMKRDDGIEFFDVLIDDTELKNIDELNQRELDQVFEKVIDFGVNTIEIVYHHGTKNEVVLNYIKSKLTGFNIKETPLAGKYENQSDDYEAIVRSVEILKELNECNKTTLQPLDTFFGLSLKK